MSLYGLAIKRPITFMMIFIAVLGFGLVSLQRLKPELFPDIDYPAVAVVTSYSGVGPEDIETLVTRPIEEAVSTVTNVKEVSSTCKEGLAMTTVEFEWGTDMDIAAADIREQIDFVKAYLPDDADEPMVLKFDPSSMPIMFIGVSGELSPAEIRKLCEDKIEPRLERVEGVAAAHTQGGLRREIQVQIDSQRLLAHGLSIQQVINVLRAENLNLPGGNIKQGQTDYTIRTMGEFKAVDEMGDIVISYAGGAPIYLKDIARVEDTFEEKIHETRVNGKPGVVLIIMKRSAANTVEVAERVKKELSQMKRGLLAQVNTQVIFDQSEFINKSIGSVASVAWQGGILAVLILFLFLRNLRSTIIIAIAIPMSLIATFVVMDFGGLTLNMMSLGGLALAVGMLVDSAIVVLENIFRHREEGRGRVEAAVLGTSEVSMPITASTLTTIAVFLPIVFVPGIAGVLFKEQALTVTFSLACALLVALTLVPLLCSQFLRIKRKEERTEPTLINRLSNTMEKGLTRIDVIYQSALNWCLDHRKIVVLSVGLIFVISLLMVWPLRLVGTEFIPKMDRGRIEMEVELPVGTKLATTEKTVLDVEEIIMENTPELEAIHTDMGIAEGWAAFHGSSSLHTATIALNLVDLSERERSQQEIENSLREKLRKVPGAKATFGRSMRMSMFGGAAPISLEIYGFDLDKAKELAQKVSNIVERVPGTADVKTSLEVGKPELQIHIDRHRASSLGLNVANIANTVQSNISGTVASRFREGGDEYDILVRLQERDRQALEDLQDIFVSTPTGKGIFLSNIASIEPAVGPATIERKGQERMVTVTADVQGRDLGSVAREIEAEMKKLPLPQGFFIAMGGEVKEQRESFRWLGLALFGAIFLVYMVMASQFESLLDPFIVMFTVPMAIIGVVWMLFFTGTIFSIIAFIGLIMLSGIVVNNGIVMVDYINLLRARGLGLREAVIQGGRTRLRPVLMTALTTIFAMTPMALGIGEGAEIRYPMARAVVGGLAVATFLTLVLVPVVYTILETFALWGRERHGVKSGQKA